MNAYDIPAAPVCTEDQIKKSRFITFIHHVPDVASARAWIQQVKAAHPAAAHHCWAYIAGPPTDSQVLGFSDDGEPAGTAGKPMLAQLQGSGIGEVATVVVRYFGGIELGTGGLVKAYGQGVQQALKQLSLARRVPVQSFTLQVPYTMLADITHLVARYEGVVHGQDFQAEVRVAFDLPRSQVDAFARHLTDLTKGVLQLPSE